MNNDSKTIEQWLAQSSEQFVEISASPLLDARVLLSHILEQPLSYLLAWPKNRLTTEQIIQLDKLIKRRLNDEPISYIIESREFWSLNLKVTPDVLIPRPETEHLVEWALERISMTDLSYNILELGTGSGAIAIAIASEKPDVSIVATDFSKSALVIANENAIKNNCKNIQFHQSDWFSTITKRPFNLIISNPPYIAENDPHLEQDGLPFEPIAALVADDNGFADIKNIIHHAKNYLAVDGLLALEHGYLQGEEVRAIMCHAGYLDVVTLKDLGGLDRLTTGRWES